MLQKLTHCSSLVYPNKTIRKYHNRNEQNGRQWFHLQQKYERMQSVLFRLQKFFDLSPDCSIFNNDEIQILTKLD